METLVLACLICRSHPVKPLTSSQAERKEGRSVLEKLKCTINPGRSAQQVPPEPEKSQVLIHFWTTFWKKKGFQQKTSFLFSGHLSTLFVDSCIVGGACRPSRSVPAPHQHGADLPAAAAGGGHAEAAGGFGAAGGAAGQVRGRAEKGQAAGSRPGGLHRQPAAADHGADADSASSSLQTQVTPRDSRLPEYCPLPGVKGLKTTF